MNKELITILFEFGFLMVFGILAAVTFFLHIPEEKDMKFYKKARITLGSSLTVLSMYFILMFILRHHLNAYLEFWLLVTFTLIHSWLTYTTMLYLLESPRFKTRHFFIDGIVPATAMLICGFIGVFIPSVRHIMQIVFGWIFGLKCIYMFSICLTEYFKCKNELREYYDELPDIRWIKILIFLSLFMSALTIVAFYADGIRLIYYLSIPVIYCFITFKIINFAPKKIDSIRKQNISIDKPVEEKKKKMDLADKITPLVDVWVRKKTFCTPDLNIRDVAKEIGTNHNYLSSYLNNHLGMTFQTWLNTLRIEEAKRILTNGEKMSIEEVGIQVGIPQSYNFSRWFRTVTGTTPYQYRKHN